MSDADIAISFLTDGGQPAGAIAEQLADFLRAAQRSLDISIYDANLPGAPGSVVQEAIEGAISRDVAVRVVYFQEREGAGQPDTTAAFVAPFSAVARPVRAFRGLMHDKYVVRDAGTPDASVWTGSTNWSTDSWTRQENVIITLPSEELAGHFVQDFEQLWQSGHIENTGGSAGGSAMLQYAGQPARVTVWFSPGAGVAMSHAVASAISGARRRIVVASPVISDGPVLGALLDVLHDGRVPLSGVYDRTQMQEAIQQWSEMPQKSWKVNAFQSLVRLAHLSSKESTPYAPGSVHDYLHVKLTVIDDSIFTGSYNLSHNGETNAENLVRVDSPALAEICAGWIDGLIRRYANGQ